MADIDTSELSREIERRHERLREIDNSLNQVGSRVAFGGVKRRISDDGPAARRIGGFADRDTRDNGNGFGGMRRRTSEIGGPPKRGRFDEDEEYYSDEDDYDDRPKRTLLSTVSLPAIETKSRDDKIKELEGTVQKDVKQRNKRMFANLLMGTLQRFQKDEKKVQSVEKVQAEKQRAVENKLEEEKQAERDKARAERADLMSKRRDEEREIRNLTRKKALIQYAEQKTAHYKQLQNFIATQAKPSIFYLPAKHTLRSLELVKQNAEAIDVLIKLRQEQLAADLEADPEAKREEIAQRRREEREAQAAVGPNPAEGVQKRDARGRSRSYSRSGSEPEEEIEKGDKEDVEDVEEESKGEQESGEKHQEPEEGEDDRRNGEEQQGEEDSDSD